MAKKKKRKSRVKATPKEPNMFLRQAVAVFLMLLAIVLLLGGFGVGSVPAGMFNAVYSVFGLAAYLVPAGLIYWGIIKFQHEDKVIPISRIIAMLVFLVFLSAWLFAGFATYNPSDGTWSDGYGGWVGATVGGLMVNAFDRVPASIILFILQFFAAFWAFGVSPKVMLGLLSPFKRRKNDDTDLQALKEEHRLKLNEGVPVEHHAGPARHSTMKNTAAKLTPSENHEALTAPSDPNWQFPGLALLNQKQDKADAGDIEGNARLIQETFGQFGYSVEMEGANIGPRVTQYTLKPPTGVKLTKIAALDDNLKLDLAATSIRIEAPIPGKRLVGIEVPNLRGATVRLASILSSDQWKGLASPLGFAIGKDISGASVVADLDRMPHLLIAGQTGSGKSVMINTLLTSLLYRNSPSDMKLILVDPKMVELAPYNDIPHLLTPVITEPEKTISALKWAVAEMERRYRTLADNGKRNIGEYNRIKQDEGMPYIVIVIDELADLMMMAARDVEALIVRIAQKARAVGIHLVLATQRPSVDVITGLIKANVPGRIAFTTQSQVDSRTIIDQIGAEKLLGMGDMLFLTSDMPKPKRVQGSLIGDEEINKVVDFIKMQRPPDYDEEIISQPVHLSGRGGLVPDTMGAGDMDDALWRDAVRVVIEGRKASTSLLQRRLRVGYARAARLVEAMEEQGIVGPADGARPREVLVSSLDEVFGGSAPDSTGASAEVYDENFHDEETA